MKHILMMLLFLMFFKGAYSQRSVKGNVIDENNKEIIGCSVRILSSDSIFLSGGVTNDVGEFHVKPQFRSVFPCETILYVEMSFWGSICCYEALRGFLRLVWA